MGGGGAISQKFGRVVNKSLNVTCIVKKYENIDDFKAKHLLKGTFILKKKLVTGNISRSNN